MSAFGEPLSDGAIAPSLSASAMPISVDGFGDSVRMACCGAGILITFDHVPIRKGWRVSHDCSLHR
jgi:hypothetical protein